jgi:anti-sigma regulatory factor (Ser/Thr protein kinase)
MIVGDVGAAPLRIGKHSVGEVCVLTVEGSLELASYALLRDTMLKQVSEIPRAVVVDIAALRQPTAATLAVFPTVWMRVSEWPGVPILLVEPDPVNRERLRHHGVTRYTPAFPTLDEALDSLDRPPTHRRSVVQLPDSGRACATARQFVHRTCRRWGCDEHTDEDACAVADALVTNAVRHGRGMPTLRLELRRHRLTIAVHDDGPDFIPPGKSSAVASIGLGLMLVEALSSAWGSTPGLFAGKVVWATLHAPTAGDDPTPPRPA